MASVILGSAATALGLTGTGLLVAKTAAVVVGAVLDAYIYQAVQQEFTDTELDLPTADDFQLQRPEPGAPIPVCLGRRAKAPAVPVFVGKVFTRTKQVASGVYVLEYFADVVIAVCETIPTNDSPVTKLYANNTLVFESTSANQVQTITSSQIGSYYGPDIPGTLGGVSWADTALVLYKQHPSASGSSDGVSLRGPLVLSPIHIAETDGEPTVINPYTVALGSGTVVSLDWPGSLNDGIAERPVIGYGVKTEPDIQDTYGDWVLSPWQDLGIPYNVEYLVIDAQTGEEEAPGDSVTVTYRSAVGGIVETGFFDSISIKSGGPLQSGIGGMIDQELQYRDGLDEQELVARFRFPPWWEDVLRQYVVAMRGVVTVEVSALNITNFGRQVPSFHCEVDARGDTEGDLTLPEAIGFILKYKDLFSDDEFDVTALDNSTIVPGYTRLGPSRPIDSLQPLLTAFNLIAYESEGVLKFVERDSVTELTVDAEELGASGSDGDPEFEVTTSDDSQNPTHLSVSFLSAARELMKDTVEERKQGDRGLSSIRTDIPVVMGRGEARAIAKRLLYDAESRGDKTTHRLPPNYMHVEGSDTVNMEFLGLIDKLYVEEVSEGADFTMEIQSVVQSDSPGDDVAEENLNISVSYSAPHVLFDLHDVPPIRDTEYDQLGVYVSVCRAGYLDYALNGATVLSQDGNDFDTFSTHGDEDVRGFTTTLLPAIGAFANSSGHTYNAGYGVIDDYTQLHVEMRNGTLSSVTEDELLQGFNQAIVGKEIIAFRDATLTSAAGEIPQYRLSGLLRGLRGTEAFSGTHTNTETFLLVNPETLVFAPLDTAEIGYERNYKAIAVGAPASAGTNLQQNVFGRHILPFAPVVKRTYRQLSTNNLLLEFRRRSRAITRMFGNSGAPLLEDTERYSVDIIYDDVTLGAMEQDEKIVTLNLDVPKTESYLPEFVSSATNSWSWGFTEDGDVTLSIGLGFIINAIYGTFGSIESTSFASIASTSDLPDLKLHVYQMSSTLGRGNLLEVPYV